MKRKIIITCIIAVLAIGIVGCSSDKQLTIFIPESFIIVTGRSPQGIIDNWDVGKTSGEKNERGYVSYEIDGDTLNVVITPQQQAEALLAQERMLKGLQQDFYSSTNNIEYNSSYSVVSYYIDPNTDIKELYSSWESVIARCGWYRILKGFGDNWMPIICVYNSETKELIAESDEEGNIFWTEEDWERSEE